MSSPETDKETCLEDLAKVPQQVIGLAAAVSEGAVAAATTISCQTDPRLATEEARRAVAERYQNMTASELSDELAARGLPNRGDVGQLRERLIDSDLDGN